VADRFCPVANIGAPPPIFSIPEKAGDYIAVSPPAREGRGVSD
jgi:hypothetical protein